MFSKLVPVAKWASDAARPQGGEGLRRLRSTSLTPASPRFFGVFAKTPPHRLAAGPHPKTALRFARWLLIGCLAFSHSSAFAQDPASDIESGLRDGSVKTEELELEIGAQKVLPSDGVRSYSESIRGVVDVRLTKDNSQFVIVGLKPGTTTLLFIMLDGTERHLKLTVTNPGKKKSAQSVEARDNIRLDFYFVQVSKSYSHQLGFGWPGQIAGPTLSANFDLVSGTFGGASAVVTDVPLPNLDIAQATGWAKVMKQAAVVTANGEKASFSGGGEVNVLVQSAVGTGVQKINFGSLVDVAPVYDSETGRIELKLHADIAELESDRGTGVPGRTTTTLDTVVNIELGQSLVLAGLSSKSKRKSKRGLPGLSQIPILGLLFGTQNQQEEEFENIVIIVPTVVDAVTMQSRQRIKDALEVYRGYRGRIDDVDFIPDAKEAKAK